MRIIDTQFDPMLKCNYDLCMLTLGELRSVARSWYDETDFKKFDMRYRYKIKKSELFLSKFAGTISNFFYAYQDVDNKHYLLDGFNRLMIDDENIDDNMPVYLKMITDELSDSKLLKIVYFLNMWKLADSSANTSHRDLDNLLDRGFRLFIKAKFDIDINTEVSSDITDRICNNEMNLYQNYFTYYNLNTDSYIHDEVQMLNLFSNSKFIDDTRNILSWNRKILPELKYHNLFTKSFITFLGHIRTKDITSDINIVTYLDKLKEDKKFFAKINKMAGNNATRRSILLWLEETYNQLNNQ